MKERMCAGMGHFVVSEQVEIYMLREVFPKARSELHYGHMVIQTSSFWRLWTLVRANAGWKISWMVVNWCFLGLINAKQKRPTDKMRARIDGRGQG